MQLDRSRQAAPQLYDALREQLVSLVLPPGTPLSRNALAAKYGVSQTPVRDALMRLQQEGLVDVFAQAATRVSKIDLLAARHAHFLRLGIELELVRDIALARDQRVLAPLVASIAEQTQHLQAQDLAAFTLADHAFHQIMYDAVDIPELWRLVRSRSGHIDRLRRLHLPVPGKMERVLAEHRTLVSALVSGSASAAQDALRQHLSGTLAHAGEIRALHPDFFAQSQEGILTHALHGSRG